MSIIEQIKAEIERLKTVQLKRIQEGDLVDAEPYDKNEAYNELLSFLSTLESEKPSDGLEDILLEFYDEYDCNVENRPLIPRIYAEKLARHFVQWGAEHLADARKTSPKDLEEAKEAYCEEHNDECFDACGSKCPHIRNAYIAGAKWQKEQMMDEWLKDRDGCFWDGVEEGKKAMEKQMMEKAVEVEGVAVWQYLDNHGRDFYKVETEDFTTHGEICEGDKVKVIIVKEGEK